MIEIEEWIATNLSRDGPGFLTEESKVILVLKEKRRKEILKDREALWHLKSRYIWLSSGDENTKFFHAYVKGIKLHNTIWQLQDDKGNISTSFEGLSSMGVKHFKILFAAQQGTSIAEIIRIAGLFSQFVNQMGMTPL